jgi:hypothetical protein
MFQGLIDFSFISQKGSFSFGRAPSEKERGRVRLSLQSFLQRGAKKDFRSILHAVLSYVEDLRSIRKPRWRQFLRDWNY